MDQAPKRTWWSRSWKWIVPVACLTPLLVCGGVGTLILVLVFGATKSSDVYTEALARARASGQVKALLGEPVKASFWASGEVEVSGPPGPAELAIPISGPKGSATLYAVATKTAGKWE
jgi:hypothetical protein